MHTLLYSNAHQEAALRTDAIRRPILQAGREVWRRNELFSALWEAVAAQQQAVRKVGRLFLRFELNLTEKNKSTWIMHGATKHWTWEFEILSEV
jgi:hypothetical protein